VRALVVLLSFCLGSAMAAFSEPTPNLVNISADSQSFGNGQSLFKGNVRVLYKDVHIQGKSAALNVDATGSPSIASFYERPKAKRILAKPPTGQKFTDTLEANTLHIYLKENSMRAEGDAVSYVTSVAANPVSIRSDVQQFDNVTKSVAASGSVRVKYDNTMATSPRALLTVGKDGKAEKIVFMGGAKLAQTDGNVTGDKITIMVASGNLIAENNVKSESLLKKEPPTAAPSKVLIYADYQQYDKVAQTILASGNVKIYYEDYTAMGPKATFKLQNRQVDRVILTGRSTMIDKSRKILADKIIITMNPKHFDAFGNVKTQFKTEQGAATAAPATEAQE
jgi:lipopolysaccharide assembly outer membrane protein LptD (OstA)